MSDAPVHLSATGPPETVLAAPDPAAESALRAALAQEGAARRAAIAAVAARWPHYLDAWARLGEVARDDVERYACYRVGYHRGLDALRASGWRGTGYVRWRQEPNRGFLRSLRGLADAATALGETGEAERCRQFLVQLDPGGVPAHG